MHVEPHLTAEELDRRIEACRAPNPRQRLRVVRHAVAGRTAPEIVELVKLSRRQIQTWIERYNAEGPEGLADKKGRGPKPPLKAEELERLKARLDAGPTAEDGVSVLRGKQVKIILEREFGVQRELGAVYHLLDSLGYGLLMPRPRHPQADPAAQESFKKANSRPKSKRSKKSIPTED